MHARELLDLAAVVTCHGMSLVDGPWYLSLAGVEQYWTASKCRFDRWGRALKDIATSEAGTPASRQFAWRATVEEILGSEVLTRVWAAVLTAHDKRRKHEDAALIGRNILHTHIDLRLRALRGLLTDDDAADRQTLEIDRLRRRLERWTDTLLAQLAGGGHDCGEFAHEPRRVDDLSAQLRPTLRPGVATNQILVSLVRIAFQRSFHTAAPNPDANARIAAGVLACLEPHMFGSMGLLPQLLSTRLLSTADDVQGLITDLFADEHRTGLGFVRRSTN